MTPLTGDRLSIGSPGPHLLRALGPAGGGLPQASTPLSQVDGAGTGAALVAGSGKLAAPGEVRPTQLMRCLPPSQAP